MSSKDHVSIEGTLLMLDDRTPHVAVPVQVIRDGEAIENGRRLRTKSASKGEIVGKVKILVDLVAEF